jgi:hypothetical protein
MLGRFWHDRQHHSTLISADFFNGLRQVISLAFLARSLVMADVPLIEITLSDVEVISSKSGGADELHLLDIRGSTLCFRPSTLSFAFSVFLKNPS